MLIINLWKTKQYSLIRSSNAEGDQYLSRMWTTRKHQAGGFMGETTAIQVLRASMHRMVFQELNRKEFRICVRVEVAVLSSPS